MKEPKFHINLLELKSAKLAIMSFLLNETDAILELTAIREEILQYILK